MTITATELKENLGKYLEMATEKDVLISKNGKVIVKMTRSSSPEKKSFSKWFGTLSNDASLEKSRLKRLR